MKAAVFNNSVLTGFLEKDNSGKYFFRYDDIYFANKEYPPVSLTLPKTKMLHQSDKLFSFFYGLLSEGINKQIQCRLLKIDEEDDFTRLLQTSGGDNIGAITIKQTEG